MVAARSRSGSPCSSSCPSDDEDAGPFCEVRTMVMELPPLEHILAKMSRKSATKALTNVGLSSEQVRIALKGKHDEEAILHASMPESTTWSQHSGGVPQGAPAQVARAKRTFDILHEHTGGQGGCKADSSEGNVDGTQDAGRVSDCAATERGTYDGTEKTITTREGNPWKCAVVHEVRNQSSASQETLVSCGEEDTPAERKTWGGWDAKAVYPPSAAPLHKKFAKPVNIRRVVSVARSRGRSTQQTKIQQSRGSTPRRVNTSHSRCPSTDKESAELAPQAYSYAELLHEDTPERRGCSK